jgi:hypothetical protein
VSCRDASCVAMSCQGGQARCTEAASSAECIRAIRCVMGILHQQNEVCQSNAAILARLVSARKIVPGIRRPCSCCGGFDRHQSRFEVSKIGGRREVSFYFYVCIYVCLLYNERIDTQTPMKHEFLVTHFVCYKRDRERAMYAMVVISSIFFTVNNANNRRISYSEFRNSNLVEALDILDRKKTEHIVSFSKQYFMEFSNGRVRALASPNPKSKL